MRSNKLKGKIVEKGMNVEQLAEKIGIDKATFYRKLNQFEKFTIGDAWKIADALGLTSQESLEIFMA